MDNLAQPADNVLTCGIVMPISASDGCSAEHWLEVLSIIKESVESLKDPKFTARLVSDSDSAGVLHQRIVKGVYDSDIVVCDVSGKNANVMFELGMRLTFDKPTIIIKDDRTDYSFDTSPIEHISYPRDLKYADIIAFKKKLAAKIFATHEAVIKDPNYSTFLKSFGTFKVAKLDEKEAPAQQVVLEILGDLQREIVQLRHHQTPAIRVDASRDEAVLLAVARASAATPEIVLDPEDWYPTIVFGYPKVAGLYGSKEALLPAIERACITINTFSQIIRPQN